VSCCLLSFCPGSGATSTHSTAWRVSTLQQSTFSFIGDVIAEFFRYAVDRRLAPFWLPFGVRPSKDGVTITDHATFQATFGFLRIETPLTNIDEAHVTRNYRWWTAAGARGSWVDDGLTFGTNNKEGVCVHFRQPVPSPLRRNGHSALTVTVADVNRLVDRLAT
jgi:hypothetical protein